MGRLYQIHALVPYELRRALYRAAKERRVSVSRLIKQAIDYYLAETNKSIPPAKENEHGDNKESV